MGLLKVFTFHNCSMLSVGISTYGCTQEVLEHERSEKVARGEAGSNSSLLLMMLVV